jgi:hypothetical protein
MASPAQRHQQSEVMLGGIDAAAVEVVDLEPCAGAAARAAEPVSAPHRGRGARRLWCPAAGPRLAVRAGARRSSCRSSARGIRAGGGHPEGCKPSQRRALSLLIRLPCSGRSPATGTGEDSCIKSRLGCWMTCRAPRRGTSPRAHVGVEPAANTERDVAVVRVAPEVPSVLQQVVPKLQDLHVLLAHDHVADGVATTASGVRDGHHSRACGPAS